MSIMLVAITFGFAPYHVIPQLLLTLETKNQLCDVNDHFTVWKWPDVSLIDY